MSMHQCPKCELRFEFVTELDDHCRNDHPEFRHDYPATAPVSAEPERPHGHTVPRRPLHVGLAEAVNWVTPEHH